MGFTVFGISRQGIVKTGIDELRISGSRIKKVKTYMYLVIIFDESLSFCSHPDHLCIKLAQNLKNMEIGTLNVIK